MGFISEGNSSEEKKDGVLSWNIYRQCRSNFFHQYNTRFRQKNLDKLSVTRENPKESSDVKICDTDNSLDSNHCDIMDRHIRYCNGNQNNWLKYFCGICIIGLSYVILQEMSNKEKIMKIFKDMEIIRKGSEAPTESDTVSKLQNTINNMKREQELYQRSLKYIVRQEFEIFSADKTGKTDYALEATGGKVVSLLPGTENVDSAKTLFGLTLCEGMHGPRAMLQAEMSPGHCWAFKGAQGGAVIKLLGKVKVTAFSLEHISASISPTGETSSAPKDFSVWGLADTRDRGQQLGTFHYDVNGPLVQTFPAEKSEVFEYIEFKVLTNHGNRDFTCVYRFRVHGELEQGSVKS